MAQSAHNGDIVDRMMVHMTYDFLVTIQISLPAPHHPRLKVQQAPIQYVSQRDEFIGM